MKFVCLSVAKLVQRAVLVLCSFPTTAFHLGGFLPLTPSFKKHILVVGRSVCFL